MTWSFDWHPAALHGLRTLPWRTAAKLDAALMQFAETGRGDVQRATPTNPRLFQIRVKGAVAVFFAEREASTIYVVGVFGRS